MTFDEAKKQAEQDRTRERTGTERPIPGPTVQYRGANGRWYSSEREARSKYSWSD